jgi:hypothetical protein
MSDGKIEKMEKDFTPQVDALLPETESLAKVNISTRKETKRGRGADAYLSFL